MSLVKKIEIYRSFQDLNFSYIFFQIFYQSSEIFKRKNDMENQNFATFGLLLELVSKELNHLAAILHVYAGGLNFMK